MTYQRTGTAGNASSAAAGTPIVRAFPFAFNSPGISTPNGSGFILGHPFYTPTPGDFLLDVWITVETAWNGTTPQADVGWFAEGNGLWDSLWPGIHRHPDLTVADGPDLRAVHFTTSHQVSRLSDVQAMWNDYNQLILPPTFSGGANLDTAADITVGARVLPGKFIDNEPMNVIATTSGDAWGADPGATQGSGTIYLVTVTPASS